MDSPVAVEEEERNGMGDIELKEDGDDLVELVQKVRSDLAKVTEVEYSLTDLLTFFFFDFW